jgi:streptomycin 6-kinase
VTAGGAGLPESFVRTVTSTFEGGAAWLERLPALLADCQSRWNLTSGPPYTNLSFNYVAPATLANGTTAVLKAGVPRPELEHEIAALRLYDGRGAVRLLAADGEAGVLLLERLEPGTTLTTLRDDDERTLIASEVMRKLWRPLPAGHPFTSVAQWGAGFSRLRRQFDGGTGPFPARMVEVAESLFDDLLASSGAPVLLHGDLHHENILSAMREPWLAIDPKGVAGEPAYEAGALIRNPIPAIFEEPDPARLSARRLDILSDVLAMDRQRLLEWSVAQAVLSAWWSYEDLGDGWQPMMRLAESLATLM